MAIMYRDQTVEAVTISNGQTDSSEVEGRHYVLWGLQLPAAFTGTSLSFKVATAKGGTYQTLYDDTGTQVTLNVAQGRSYTLPAALASWPWWKIVSGSAEGADRALTVVGRS